MRKRNSIPTGLHHSAQGCRVREATLGQPPETNFNPNGVVSAFRRDLPQPFEGWERLGNQHQPRVARSSQPWAPGRNPFGIRLHAARVAILIAFVFFLVTPARAETVSIVIPTNAAPRVQFGAEKLAEALKSANWDAAIAHFNNGAGPAIFLDQPEESVLDREGFLLGSYRGNDLQTRRKTRPWILPRDDLKVVGADDSGILYGCLELAKRIRAEGGLPIIAKFRDHPVMTLRGTCVGMQKTYILPGRKVYEYPYTPELFPWFYDKTLWREYLDFLVANRMNTLYLWNGHPFASLVRLKDYPEAVEVPEDIFAKNVEMFRWLTTECDKRGIWLVQMFYNIFLPKPLADETRHLHAARRAHAAGVGLHAQGHRRVREAIPERRPDGLPRRGVAGHGESNQLVHEHDSARRPGRHEGRRVEGATAGRHPHPRDESRGDHARVLPGVFQPVHRDEIQRRIAHHLRAARQGARRRIWRWRSSGRTWSTSTSSRTSNRSATARSGSSRNACRPRATGWARAGFTCIRWRIGTGRIRRTSPIRRSSNGTATGSGSRPGRATRGIPTCPEPEDRAYWIGRLAELYGCNTNAAGEDSRRLQRRRRSRADADPPLRHHRGQPPDPVARHDARPVGEPEEIRRD